VEEGLKTVLDRHSRESLVLVRADRVTVLERFVGVVDEVRGFGFRQVSLEVVRS
jgi:biopolymer transport protein ExbD